MNRSKKTLFFISKFFLLILFIELFYVIYNYNFFNFTYLNLIFFYFFPLFLLIFIFISLKKKKINWLLITFSTIVSTYLFFIIYSLNNFWNFQQQIKIKDEKISFYKETLQNKHEFDDRTKIEYIIDKRKTDSNTYSYLFPMHPYNLDNLNRIRWLGGISNSNIVLCRKNGQWLNIVSDRYGFNNKNDTWDENLNFAIVGDSFIHTNCLETKNDVVRKLESKLNSKILNLGLRAIGLIEYLAITKEYLSYVKPKNVIIVIFEGNDFEFNNKDRIFQKYLNDENFKQNLINRQSEINYQQKKAHEIEFKRELNLLEKKILKKSFKTIIMDQQRNFFYDLFLLRRIRQKFNISFKKNTVENSKLTYQERYDLTKEILLKIKKEIDTWEGNLFVTYIPTPYFKYGQRLDKNAFNSKNFKNTNKSYINQIRKDFPNLLKDLEINYLDIMPYFLNYENPDEIIHYWDYHFNEYGYELLSNSIYKELIDFTKLDSFQ